MLILKYNWYVHIKESIKCQFATENQIWWIANWQKCHYQILSQREDQFACGKVETQQGAIVIGVVVLLKCYSMISYRVRSKYETITYFTSTRILMHNLILVHNIFDVASQILFSHIFSCAKQIPGQICLQILHIGHLNECWKYSSPHYHFAATATFYVQGISKRCGPGCVKLGEKVMLCLSTAGSRAQLFHLIFTQPWAQLLKIPGISN